MKKSLTKLLSATVLLACTAAPSFAGTISTATFDMSYSDLFTPVSSVGNTVTFASNYYFSAYGNDVAVLKDLFVAATHSGQSFTGNVSVKTTVDYTLGNYQGTSSNYRGSVATTVDVLSPNCGNCGIYESKLLADGQFGASANLSAPGSGTATGSIDLKNTFEGTYPVIMLYVINDYQILNASGMLHLNTFSVTLDTVGPISSPVPELPPVAMLGLGLVALGLRARFGGRKTKAKAALAA